MFVKNIAASVMIGAVMVLISGCMMLIHNTEANAAPKHCVTVVFAWRTPTGHEADAPVVLCGTPLKKNTECLLNKPVQPGTVGNCFVVKNA